MDGVSAVEAGTGYWCRHCTLPVRLAGGNGLAVSLRKAVHALNGDERAPDGHLAAPTDDRPALRAEADRIEAQFGGLFTVMVRFGFFDAHWRDLPAGQAARHYEADTGGELRALLSAARAAGMEAALWRPGMKAAGMDEFG